MVLVPRHGHQYIEARNDGAVRNQTELLLLATRNPTARRIFYEGPRGEEPGILFLALLWAVPIVLVFLGIIWWLLGQFFH